MLMYLTNYTTPCSAAPSAAERSRSSERCCALRPAQRSGCRPEKDERGMVERRVMWEDDALSEHVCVFCNNNKINLMIWNQVYDNDPDLLSSHVFTCRLVFLKRSFSSSMLPCSSSNSSSSWAMRASSLLFSSSNDDLTHTFFYSNLLFWLQFIVTKLPKAATTSPDFIT